MKIILIAAVARNQVIGKDNDLLWRLPVDFKRFKAKTIGHHILMGRKTYESFDKPLPCRTHLVITRNPSFEVAEGHFIFSDIEKAVIQCGKWGIDTLFVIGGGEIYTQTLPIADELMLTEVDANPDGDTFFPEFDKANWVETFREFHPKDERHQFSFSFVNYEKRRSN